MTRTHICGHCNQRFNGFDAIDGHECAPECALCGETWDSKADAVGHDCPERGDAPTEDRVPESERIDQRERRKREGGRARERRLGLDR